MSRSGNFVRIVGLLAILAPASLPAMVRSGDAAPDFALLDNGGTSYTLNQFRGKLVLLAFIGWG